MKKGASMFIEERHQKILETLETKKRATVQFFSLHFKVSEDTIRRDLRILEEKGKVQRTHGGAILPKKAGLQLSVQQREKIDPEKKGEIAKLALSYIEDNDTLLLDGSTTVCKIIPHLNQFKRLTIITHSVITAYHIINLQADIKLYLLGGIIKNDVASAVSYETIEKIQTLNVDKVFQGLCSISANWGISTPVIEEVPVQKAMLEAGKKIFLLVSSCKFGIKGLFQVAPIKLDYTIITDSKLTQDQMSDFAEYGKKGLKIITPSS